jgi:coat protein Gp5
MPNTLTNIMPKILARGLMSLRQRVIMPRLVNSDYAMEAAKKGDVINVPIPVAQTASDVVPSNTPPVPASNTPDVVQIPLDNWKHSDFHLTDKELVQIDRNEHFFPMQAEEAVKALANAVNIDIFDEYKGVFGFAGTAGTTPFVTGIKEATELRKVLNQQLCPLDQRRVVLNFDAEANALTQSAFRDASQSGKSQVVQQGELGVFFGMDWFADDHVPTHVSTPLSAGAATVNGAHAAGVKVVSIAKATNPSNLVAGDIIKFAGDNQTYVVTANVTLAVGNTNVNIYPGLALAKTGGEAVTLTATHVANLAFHRNAFAFATRPLQSSTVDLELGNQMMSMQDPKSGIVLRLEVSRQYKQTVWDFDILWGAKLVRPELAARLAGIP